MVNESHEEFRKRLADLVTSTRMPKIPDTPDELNQFVHTYNADIGEKLYWTGIADFLEYIDQSLLSDEVKRGVGLAGVLFCNGKGILKL